MTRPRYDSCAAGSQVHGITAPAGYAWNVNLDDGNTNRNHQDNKNFVRAVRAGECHDAVHFRDLHSAWRCARAGKKPSADQTSFDANWMEQLFNLEYRLTAHTWRPSPPTCFIAKAPKAREIHAPAFADRVVHHWLVPQLEELYEPTFIHDSYSNRVGKGTHAAVDRLQAFVRQVHSGQGGGWYLQLDVKNFFNSIHRPTLYVMLKARMERAALPEAMRRAVHALLRTSIRQTGVRWACTDSERAAVPPHKRLENAPRGCGIAIGNLSSQFFANVYLDRLDQFVKHTLKAARYVRYVDDFVLVHRDRAQLEAWRTAIEAFLTETLHLQLKAEQRLRPLHAGVDFLGYVVYPTHRVVRRRVVAHAITALQACRSDQELLRSVWASYAGHFRHAASFRLVAGIHDSFPWLAAALAPAEPEPFTHGAH